MNGEITSALIGIATGVLSGIATGVFRIRYNYKDLYARSVSTNRMGWINNFREEIGAIVAGLRYKKRVNRENKQMISFIRQKRLMQNSDKT